MFPLPPPRFLSLALLFSVLYGSAYVHQMVLAALSFAGTP